MVELRGISDGDGFIEICGKDEYAVFDRLNDWLAATWECDKLESGDLTEETPVPFCDALYEWKGFRSIGDDGLNNMGKCTMLLVDFMCGTLGWTLGVINGGNVGKKGDIREQQVIFKSPHPMNFVVPHLMIELRSAGFIEVCGDDGAGDAMDELKEFFVTEFKGEQLEQVEVAVKVEELEEVQVAQLNDYADLYFKAGEGVFKETGTRGDNNLGLLTTKICNRMGKIKGWSLVTCNGGNYGETGKHREQQLVFRCDSHPLGDQEHLLVELRDAGYVEVCGLDENSKIGDMDKDAIYKNFETWAKKSYACKKIELKDNTFCDAKFKWTPKVKDIMAATAQVVSWFHKQGWQLSVASQGTVKVGDNDDSREQQLIFRSGASSYKTVEPHLIVELYAGEGDPELYEDENKTQVLGNQFVRMCKVGAGNVLDQAVNKFHEFLFKFMGGKICGGGYSVDVFLSRGYTDNNLGQWTMRVCDFMVDELGWSFIVCNVCNMGEWGHKREQQLIFRWDGEKATVPRSSSKQLDISGFEDPVYPDYWTISEVLGGESTQSFVSCEDDEIKALQALADSTYRRILTRDRIYEYQTATSEAMPYRLEVVRAFRSEHAYLWLRLQEKRAEKESWEGDEPFEVKGRNASELLQLRLNEGEAYLFHGTNPSSAMSIMKTGFALSAAGSSVGTMFGEGIYLAECSSKSDEYARDDGGNTFPGLMALLVCRTLIGTPLVVQEPGDHIKDARDSGCDCVCGDRERKVGTYREFVLFDEAQVYPEYTIIYKRVYDPQLVPAHMRTRPSGTTGRSWQVRLDKGFADVAVPANLALKKAQEEGLTEVDIEIANVLYKFDLVSYIQINTATKKQRQIRPPMVQ